MSEEWAKEHIQVSFSARTYIKNVIIKFEELLGKTALHTYKNPMEDKHHSELDDSHFVVKKSQSSSALS